MPPNPKSPRRQAAPPLKRANPKLLPVRLHDGDLVAHVTAEHAEELLRDGAARSFRNGDRRYLRLERGITIERSGSGWDVIELLRKWHGDKRAAGYVAHKDGLSERLSAGPPKRSNGGGL